MFGSNTGGFGTAFGGFSTSTPAAGNTFGSTAQPGASSGLFGNVGKMPTFGASSVFGTPTSTAGATSSFMAPTTSTASGFGGFGTGTVPVSTGLFGSSTFGSTGPSAGLSFGKPNTMGFGSAAPSFGTMFGQPATGTSTGVFGQQPFGGMTSMSTTSAAATTLTPQQQMEQAAREEAARIASVVTVPLVYNDERDKILAQFNQLQAKWGIGKGVVSQGGPPIIFTPDNPFYKFKTIAYNTLPTNRPEDGLVSLLINKKAEEIKSLQPSFTELLHRDVVKAPNMVVFLHSVVDFGAGQSLAVIYVIEKGTAGQGRKLSSSELLAALEQPHHKPALTNLRVLNMAEITEYNKAALEQYLSVPPNGIDSLLWDQAKADNPDPQRLIPIPIIGFEDLNRRLQKQQELQTGQMDRLEVMAQEAADLKKKCELARARIEEFRLKQQDLAHRVLKVMVSFEVNRKIGLGIQSEEETLKASLEEIVNEIEVLNRGKLNELQASAQSTRADPQTVHVEEPISEEMCILLSQQQRGIADLTRVIKEDLKKLDDIQRSLSNAST